MCMNRKIKLTIIFLLAGCLLGASWYFLRGSQVKKVEIVGSEQQSIEKNIETGDKSIADTPVASVGSSFEKEPVVVIEDKNKDGVEPSANSSKLKIVNKLVDSGFQAANGRKIDTIIIHSSYDALGDDPFSIDGIIKEYRDYGVSAHYLIGRDGSIYRLVQEKNIAYHAGVSSVPDGRTGANAFSLGIEMVNTKTGQMTAQQYTALKSLISDIKGRYEIKYVLGHNQIAPGRKDDPWNFNWNKLK